MHAGRTRTRGLDVALFRDPEAKRIKVSLLPRRKGEPRALQGHTDIAMALAVVRLEREKEHQGFPSRATRGPLASKGFAFLPLQTNNSRSRGIGSII